MLTNRHFSLHTCLDIYKTGERKPYVEIYFSADEPISIEENVIYEVHHSQIAIGVLFSFLLVPEGK